MNQTLKLAICVFVGSGIGGVCRFLISDFFTRRIHFSIPVLSNFPLPTFIVNVVGCFLIGLIYGFADRHVMAPETKTLLATGFCGGLTTFSTFTNENLLLFTNSQWPELSLYVILSLSLGFIAARTAYALFYD